MAEYRVPNILGFEWQKSVLDKDLATPPSSPNEGDRYLIASGATDDWSGHDGDITWYENGVWYFIPKKEGMFVYVKDEDKLYYYNGSNWQEFASGSGSNADTLDGYDASDFSFVVSLPDNGDSVVWEKIGELRGVASDAGAELSFIIYGSGDIGCKGRQTLFVNAQQRGENGIKVDVYSLENGEVCSRRITVGYVQVGTFDFDIYIKRENFNPCIVIGHDSSFHGSFITNPETLTSEPSGIVYVNANKIWHSGNDGSGSGLDADLVRGEEPYHAFVRPPDYDSGWFTAPNKGTALKLTHGLGVKPSFVLFMLRNNDTGSIRIAVGQYIIYSSGEGKYYSCSTTVITDQYISVFAGNRVKLGGLFANLIEGTSGESDTDNVSLRVLCWK